MRRNGRSPGWARSCWSGAVRRCISAPTPTDDTGQRVASPVQGRPMQKTASLCPDAREAGAVHLMAVDSITCPDCGLVVRVTCGASRSRLIYDIKEWKRRCKRGDVDQPAWCFVQ